HLAADELAHGNGIARNLHGRPEQRAAEPVRPYARTPGRHGKRQHQDGRVAGVHEAPVGYHGERSVETQISANACATSLARWLRTALLRANPHRSAAKVLLLPDRNDLLQPRDQPVTR